MSAQKVSSSLPSALKASENFSSSSSPPTNADSELPHPRSSTHHQSTPNTQFHHSQSPSHRSSGSSKYVDLPSAFGSPFAALNQTPDGPDAGSPGSDDSSGLPYLRDSPVTSLHSHAAPESPPSAIEGSRRAHPGDSYPTASAQGSSYSEAGPSSALIRDGDVPRPRPRRRPSPLDLVQRERSSVSEPAEDGTEPAVPKLVDPPTSARTMLSDGGELLLAPTAAQLGS